MFGFSGCAEPEPEPKRRFRFGQQGELEPSVRTLSHLVAPELERICVSLNEDVPTSGGCKLFASLLHGPRPCSSYIPRTLNILTSHNGSGLLRNPGFITFILAVRSGR